MTYFYVNQRYVMNIILTGMLCCIFVFLPSDIVIVQLFYTFSIMFIYLLCLPSNLVNPKNFVFGYYFMWYAIAPLFANRYKDLSSYGENVIYAYEMFFLTFSIAMLTLDYVEKSEKKYDKEMKVKTKLTLYEKIFLGLVYIASLIIYIHRTGGLTLWLTNPNDAFFSRGGSGFLYLLFEYAAMLLLFFGGKKCGLKNKIPYIVFCIVTMYFCGSKSTMMLFAFMFISDQLMEMKLLEKRSIVLVCLGIVVFVLGMYIRAGQYMNNLDAVISTCLNYFDTLDEFLILLEDYTYSFFKTLFYPINWLLLKFGVYIGSPYYDTSIWLTTIYYPESWAGGGTHQWPLEAFLYINFHYWLGIPFVIAYFLIIGWIYKRGKTERGVWRFIYINECITIFSHLRGGLFNYWYIYLLPFYLLLIFWEKRIKSTSY